MFGNGGDHHYLAFGDALSHQPEDLCMENQGSKALLPSGDRPALRLRAAFKGHGDQALHGDIPVFSCSTISCESLHWLATNGRTLVLAN